MVNYLETRLLRNLCRHGIQTIEVRIDNPFAPGTDDMGVGERFASVVTVASLTEFQFEYFSEFLQHVDCLVNRGKARGGEISDDNAVDFLNAGMPLAAGEDPQDRQALRSDPLSSLFQFQEHVVKARFNIIQGKQSLSYGK